MTDGRRTGTATRTCESTPSWYERNRERKKRTNVAWQKNNRDKVNGYRNKRFLAVKQKAVERLGNKCMECEQTYPTCVYDFHHKDPKEKKYTVSKMLLNKWEDVVKELDKCILLCANCHRVIHHGE